MTDNVVQLRKRTPQETALDVPDEVVDAEIVDDPPPYAEAAVELWRPVVAVRTAVTHPRTQATARNISYLAVGANLTWHRIQDRRPSAVYKHGIRTGQRTGDDEKVRHWEERRAVYWRERHQRRLDRPDMILKHLKTSGIVTAAGLSFIGLSMAVADANARQFLTPFKTFIEAVRFLVTAVTVTTDIATSTLFLTAATVFGTAWMWDSGRRNIERCNIAWANALQPEDPETHMIVTADGIVVALQHLRIPEMKKAFKDGWIPNVILPPIREGRGYHAVVELPLGVTPEMVCDLRPVLARNLHRAEIETWPSDAEKAGTGPAGYLDLWVADRGALSKPAPEYPLLHEGTADVFEGVPGGVSPRGDAVTIPLVGNNFVAGGQMGQGKSNACRVILLGAALDPLAIIDAFVFANNGDFDAYKPRLANYRRGIDDDTAHAALSRLRWLYDEVGRREGRLAELGAKKVTRRLADQHPDLRPIISLYSECHELFGHPEYGEEAAELACKTAKRARKTAIVLGFDTQSSRKEAIPPKLVELVSVNACFYVKTWRSNDGFLGDGCFQAGIRATELRPGRDRGTSVIIGVSDAPFELLKWYFVEVNDDTGYDAATDVIARAVDAMADGTLIEAKQLEPVEERDLLDDLDEVLDVHRVKLADVPAMLRDLAPWWRPYQTMKGTDLRDELAGLNVKAVKTGGIWYLDPETVREANAARATADVDDWEGGASGRDPSDRL